MSEVTQRILRVDDFIAEELEVQAKRMVAGGDPAAEAFFKHAAYLRSTTSTNLVRVTEVKG